MNYKLCQIHFESKRPWEPRSHSKCYCAATVTAVAAVAAAGTAAYGAYSQGQKAKDLQSQTQAGNSALYGTKVNVPDFPKYDPTAGANDYLNSLPLLGQISKQVTQQQLGNANRVSGGQLKPALHQQGSDINQMLQGQVPTDVQDAVQRIVAERGGGAFMPDAQGNQQAQADFARSIGKTSFDIMKEGLSFAPQWENIVDSFTYKPQDAAHDALAFLRERTGYAENAYVAELNKARAGAMPDPGVLGAFRDNASLGLIQSQNQTNQLNALLGVLKAGGAAYSGVKSDFFPATKPPGGMITGAARNNAMGLPAYSV